MRRFIFNLVSVLFSAVKFGIMKLFHFHHFFYSGIQRFSPNTEVVIAEGGTIRLGRHVRAHRRSKLLAMDGGTLEIGSNTALGNGVSVNCMESIVIGEGVQIGPDTKIYDHDHDYRVPGGIGAGKFVTAPVTIGDNSWIGCNVVILRGTSIGKNCIVKNTYITESTLEENVSIGPFSQVRPGCHIAAGCKIGDFVEVKNSHIGQKTAIAHLTYVGDTDCGSGVNFGCGVAIANFNGKEKFRTTIGDGAFLGCNTNLVAPVTIGAGAYTAAGATVTRDVPEDAMLIARAEQTVKPGLARRFRREKK